MATNCDPQSLIMEAKCFSNCLSEQEREAIKTLLLARIAGGSTDPQTLLTAARCFLSCVPHGFYKAIQAYLLCQIVNGQVCPPCPPAINYGVPLLEDNVVIEFTNIQTIVVETNTSMATLDVQNATAIIADFIADGNAALRSISAPLLITIGGQILIGPNPLLSAVFFPSLVSSALNLTINQNPILTSINLASYVPRNGQNLTMDGNALDEPSVDLVLARAVQNAAYVSGNIDLSGGTNEPPSAAGLVNKGILIARGVTVSTN